MEIPRRWCIENSKPEDNNHRIHKNKGRAAQFCVVDCAGEFFMGVSPKAQAVLPDWQVFLGAITEAWNAVTKNSGTIRHAGSLSEMMR